jgi:hypothetical protein
MPAQLEFYHQLCQKISSVVEPVRVRKTSIQRLALLVIGIIAAESCVLDRAADELFNLKLTKTSYPDHIRRRIQRTLSDKSIRARVFYERLLRQAIDWDCARRGGGRIILVVDESTKKDDVHLFRVSLCYRGGAIPLSWAIWKQNTALPKGRYWTIVDAVLSRAARLLPEGAEVLVTADRAYDNPPFIDRVAARGWHWIVRCKAKSKIRFRDRMKRELALSSVIAGNVNVPGKRWKARGEFFKDAGWRQATIIAVWGIGQKESLVVLTDLTWGWEAVHWYGCRFWTETGFRNDKRKGWQWEDSQVRRPNHHRRLLIAMAWASLIALSYGVGEAEARCQRLTRIAARRKAAHKPAAKPWHARQSLFTLGLRRASQWLREPACGPLRLSLPKANTMTWSQFWRNQQSLQLIC